MSEPGTVTTNDRAGSLDRSAGRSAARRGICTYAYRFGWTLMLGALVTAATAWVAWRVLADRRPSGAAFVMPAVVIGLAVATVLTAVAATSTGTNLDAAAAETGRAARRLIPHLRRDGGQIVLEEQGTAGGWSREGILLVLVGSEMTGRVRDLNQRSSKAVAVVGRTT